ncbi:MAG: FAD-dependent oxidoreductase, partial [Planctomycetota bacterium]
AAAIQAQAQPRAEAPRSTAMPPVTSITELDGEVAVIGLGTGGPLAAIAAAEAGARVVAVEPYTLPGGVGTIAGIHGYCGGVDGGLQYSLDTEIAAWMDTLSIRVFKTKPWHPDVKAWVLDRRMQQAGVERHYGCLLWDVSAEGRRIETAMIACGSGAMRLRAGNWIDATGDGDLCVRAGADHFGGREHDGRSHAYTQSARLILPDADGIPRMAMNNFDSGWVHPEDPADWTRARCLGLQPYIDQLDGPDPQRYAAICPTLGLRQSRQIACRRTLRVDDIMQGRETEDCIGYMNCGIDNHSVDIVFESDDFLTAQWVHARIGDGGAMAGLPYGMVLPRDLDNTWIACRACGVDRHSHYAMRMMRDIQRLGEVCGLAAALCRNGIDNNAVDRAALRAGLEANGALHRHNGKYYGVFGFKQFADIDQHLGRYDREAAIAEARVSLAAGKAHLGMRWMLQELDAHRDFLHQQLASDDLEVVYLAASLLAVAGDATAGDRLLQLWRDRVPGGGGHPHWYRALVLLRCCGTAAHLRELVRCLPPQPLFHDVAVALLITASRIRERHADAQTPAVAIADWARDLQVSGSRRPPMYPAVTLMQDWLAGTAIPERVVNAHRRCKHVAAARHVDDDSTWQVQLVRARLALACQQDADEDLRMLHADERAYVRHAAARLLERAMG